MEARVTSSSQVERLRERMEQAEVRHGQEIRADLPGIRVIGLARNWFTPKGPTEGGRPVLHHGADSGAAGDDPGRRAPATD
jgi:hypothetical protein